jgi:carnitine 3-dehydrogenase
MGMFETYRIAGGEAGMRHFIAQFGPCLSWPWTKLMDVPELTEELTDRIAEQSDAQSGRYSIRELERIRDNNLVGIIRSLKGKSALQTGAAWGAGALIRAQDRAMMPPVPDTDAPFVTVRRAVPLDWTDYNGHMNEANFLSAFADASDRFMEVAGIDTDYIAAGSSTFTAETHIRHLGEVMAGQTIEVRTRLLAAEGRKVHVWHEMRTGDGPVATAEHLLVHMDLKTRTATPPGPAVAARLAAMAVAHGKAPRPGGAGRFVGQPR